MKSTPTEPKRVFAAVNKPNELELVMYDVIGGGLFYEGITSKGVKAQLDAAGNVGKIVVRLNSPGGDVFEGSAIYSLLAQHPATVECYVDGLAASAALTIAMAADKVHISEVAMMMCHNALGVESGYATDHIKYADLLTSVSSMMRDVYAKRTDMPPDEMQKLMDAETWMTAQEAVEYGFADDILSHDAADDDDEESEEDDALTLAKTFDLSMYRKTPAAFTRIAASAITTKLPVAVVQPEIPAKPEQKETVPMSDTAAAPAVEIKTNERANEVDAILAMAKIYNQEDVVRKELQKNEKLTLGEAKAIVGDAVLNSAKTGQISTTESRMSAKERKEYSIRRAIMSAGSMGGSMNCLEREISDDLYKEMRNSVPGLGNGILIPTQVRADASNGMDTSATNYGKETVATDLLSLIEYLRKNMIAEKLGIRTLSGLTSNIAIPRQTAITASSWAAEHGSSTETYPTFDQLQMTPKRNTAASRYDVNFLRQSTLDAEAFVREDLGIALALGVDYAIFNGSGTAPVPKGVIPNLGSGQKTAYNSSTIYANIVAMQTALANANALKGSLAYVGTPAIRGLLKQTPKMANTIAEPIWKGDMCDDFPGYASTNLPTNLGAGSPPADHAFLFGDWSQVVLGEWGAVEIIVDPYTAANKGEYVVNAHLLADIAIRHVEAFNLLTGYTGS